MNREVPLPSGFEELSGLVRYVVKRGVNQYSSTCPECGGDVHTDGTWPDRFCMWPKSKATGSCLGFCRHCGLKWWPGKTDPSKRPTPEQEAVWLEERLSAEQQRLAEIQTALEILQKEQAWVKYHEAAFDNGEVRQLYAQRGIKEDFWIMYWSLGFNPAKQVWYEGQGYLCQSLTIPIFETLTRKALNIKHRLLNPPNPGDKYRPEIKGLPAALFVADLDKPLKGKTLLVEGEFKAMVSYLCADDPTMQVVGVPSKSPDLDMLDKLAECEPVFVCLDPDAYQVKGSEREPAISRLAAHLGNRARIIRLPGKIDDLINAGAITKPLLKSLMNGARVWKN